MQIESWFYSMRPNREKWVNLKMNQNQASIKFKDCTSMKREDRAAYLVSILTDTANNGTEVTNRISKANSTANKLGLFWQKANTPIIWKLRVYDAIIKSQLLETK
jgi:hypothetical protein